VGFILELGSKETWALITWLVSLLIYMPDHKVGKVRTAILGGLGFFVIWICYLGVNFLGKDCIVTVGYLIISLKYEGK
jgi:ABC-type transport system involved in cytochrome c biogenesis permease subunit